MNKKEFNKKLNGKKRTFFLDLVIENMSMLDKELDFYELARKENNQLRKIVVNIFSKLKKVGGTDYEIFIEQFKITK